MLESRVLRNSSEFNIPYGNNYGYEAMYFGVNLILMLEYRMSFDVNVLEGDDIEVLITTRKNFERWKSTVSEGDTVPTVYRKKEKRITDIFIPASSDSYVLILNNRYCRMMKRVVVALTHTWKQEMRTDE